MIIFLPHFICSHFREGIHYVGGILSHVVEVSTEREVGIGDNKQPQGNWNLARLLIPGCLQ
jgi:hypothetical protein